MATAGKRRPIHAAILFLQFDNRELDVYRVKQMSAGRGKPAVLRTVSNVIEN